MFVKVISQPELGIGQISDQVSYDSGVPSYLIVFNETSQGYFSMQELELLDHRSVPSLQLIRHDYKKRELQI